MNRSLTLLTAFCTLGAACASAQVRPSVESPDVSAVRTYRHWTAFLHPRFGYEVPVPPGVSAVGNPRAAAESTFVSRDGSFVMSAWGGSSPQSAMTLLEAQWNSAQRQRDRSITYQKKSRSWFVVSGTDRTGTEFYEKFIVRGNKVAAFTLTYPRSRLREFEPWVEEIENGFRIISDPDEGPAETAPGRFPVSAHARESSRLPPQSAAPMERSERPPASRPKVTKSKVDLTPPQKKTTARAAASETAPARETSAPEKTAPEKTRGDGSYAAQDLPFGQKVVGRTGFVYSPYLSSKSLVDVVDIPSGTKVKCPYTGKIFRVP